MRIFMYLLRFFSVVLRFFLPLLTHHRANTAPVAPKLYQLISETRIYSSCCGEKVSPEQRSQHKYLRHSAWSILSVQACIYGVATTPGIRLQLCVGVHRAVFPPDVPCPRRPAPVFEGFPWSPPAGRGALDGGPAIFAGKRLWQLPTLRSQLFTHSCNHVCTQLCTWLCCATGSSF